MNCKAIQWNGSPFEHILQVWRYDKMSLLEAKGINLYSGSITINAGQDGINVASSGSDCDETVQCSGNCAHYINIKGGSLTLTSEEDGLDANGDIYLSQEEKL